MKKLLGIVVLGLIVFLIDLYGR